MNSLQKILFGIAGVVVLIGIGVGIYFLFFANKPALTVGNPSVTLPGSADAGITETTPTVGVQALGVPSAGAGTLVAPRLIRITDRPVALGALALFVPGTPAPKTASSTLIASSTTAYSVDPDVKVEYIERESGNIYAFQAHGRTLTRLTNKTLPGVVEASWVNDGSLAFARFIAKTNSDEHIASYALPVNGGVGYFLEQDLEQVLVTGSSTLMTLMSGTDGSTATLSTPAGTNVRTLFNSPLSAIRVRSGGGVYVATTKASFGRDGYTFVIDPKSGTFTHALGPLTGLSAVVSPTGKFILYSYLERGKIVLSLFDMTSHTATRLPLTTLAEKCVWSGDGASIYCGVPTDMVGKLPDDWYQGVTSFTDRLWKIDLSSRVAVLLIDPKQAGDTDIDMTGLTIDRTSDVLVFTNKQDGTLWSYDL